MKKSIGIAPAKCIILGEHAVVYGHSAIATTVGLYSKVTIMDNYTDEIRLVFENINVELAGKDLDEIVNNTPKSFMPMLLPIKIGLEFWEMLYVIKITRVHIRFFIEFWVGAGLGASASLSVALYRALQDFYNKEYSELTCFHFSLQMEKITHMAPSGLDNTICSKEGTIIFKDRNSVPVSIENEKMYPMIIIYSGQAHSTTDAIKKIDKIRNMNVDAVNESFKYIGGLAEQGKYALEAGDMKKLQILMEENQTELEKYELMTPQMDKILNLGKNLGIRGLKMTGGGLGGCLIAIDQPEKLHKFKEKLDVRNIESKIVLFNIKSGDINYGII